LAGDAVALVAEQVGDHLGNPAGCARLVDPEGHTVDGDVAIAELEREDPRERANGGRGGRVSAVARQHRCVDRAEQIDDRATFSELARCHSIDDQRGPEVRPAHLVEVVERHLGQWGRGDVPPHRVDDRVDRTERLDRLVEEPLHVQHVGDVGADRDHSAATLEHRVHG
jgi:hypothetical protein